MKNKVVWYCFFSLVILGLLSPLWTFSVLFFPYITSKAFYFRVVVLLLAPFYFYLIYSDQKLRPNLKAPINLAVIGFVVVNLIAALAGVNVSRSLWGNFERMGGVWYLMHLTALYFYVLVIGQAGIKYLKIFLQLFLGVTAVLVINGIFGKLGWATFTLDPSLPERVSSTFGNPIFFASYLIIPLFISLYLIVNERAMLQKRLYIFSAFLSLIGIYLSATRGALVGILASAVVFVLLYVFFSESSKAKKFGIFSLGAVIAFFALLIFISPKFSEESAVRRLISLNDSNSKARLIQWQMAFQGFKERPILGVGPENYYVIFNEFYNTEMYKYDASWFDKPHNYWLEVLTTSGVLGFVFYLAILWFFALALYKGFKTKKLNLLQFGLLIAGLVAYQVQNLFVFDTVSASMVWHIFLAIGISFAQAPWQEDAQKQKNLNKNPYGPYIFFGSLCFILYAEFVINIMPIQASKALNFGQVYSQVDALKAADYFYKALAVKNNFDKRDTANFFARFAANLPGSPLGQTNEKFVKDTLNKAIAVTKEQAIKTKNDPILWSSLSTLELNSAIYDNREPVEAKQAIDRALELAPKRVEILQVKLQYYGFLKDWKNVVLVAEEINNLNPNKPDIKWQLAMAYYLEGSLSKAVAAADEALELGFKFKQLQQFAWYIDYQQKQTNWEKVAALLEQAIELEPGDIGLYTELAKTYAKLGNKEKAQMLADQIMIIDPSQKAAMQAFVNSLK